jgi:hypothetical protein
MAHPRMYRDDDPSLADLRRLCPALPESAPQAAPESAEIEAWGRPERMLSALERRA